MPSFSEVLGHGKILHSGAAVSGDPHHRSGELVMGTHEANGRTSFRLVLHNLDFVPTSASVTRCVVTGYGAAHCSGPAQCGDSALPANPIPFAAPQSNQGHYFFAAQAHDNQILMGLLKRCGCSEPGVRSVKVEIQVEVLPAPAPGVDMIFGFCFECSLIEVARQEQQSKGEVV